LYRQFPSRYTAAHTQGHDIVIRAATLESVSSGMSRSACSRISSHDRGK